ncbi:MAG: MATE family efflux transporter [Spirochaetaceae bacterium]|jgi:putative MATE family efflux protein|nr:MATE family efflux transporter [Spirochaetaceae bacterium]
MEGLAALPVDTNLCYYYAMTKNLTVGPPGALIFAFAVPLVIGNLFQQLYNMADSFIVARTIGMEALAAIGCTGSLAFLILGFIIGVTSGAAIITSQRYGAGDVAGVKRSFVASLVIGAAVTVVLMAFSIGTLRPLLSLLNTPERIYEYAYSYFVVMLWGMPAITLFNLLSNMMRAVGDSRTPLYFLVIACIVNIALDYLFILVFKSGVAGAGIATVISQFFAALACIPAIKKRFPLLAPGKGDFQLDVAEIIRHVKIALPVGFQWSIIAIGAVAVTFALNGLGYAAVAAFTTGQKIDQLATMPLSSYGQAMTTFAAQNFGAKKYDRIKKGVAQGLTIALGFSVVMGLLFFFFGDRIAAVFLHGEQEAIRLSHRYLKVTGVFFSLLALLFCTRQTLQGLGDSLVPTLAGVMELLMRTFAALILTSFFGYTGLCFAGPLAFIGALIPLSIALRSKFAHLTRLSSAAASGIHLPRAGFIRSGVCSPAAPR